MFSRFHYALNRGMRDVAMRFMSRFPDRKEIGHFDIRKQKIDKILLARPNFRMGNSILAIPGIHFFRKNFPNARIDFVGSPISKVLFQNLPIDHHYEVTRGFLESSWCYPGLVRRLRSARYELAVELSCSQSALGAFVVGLSGAKWRAGRKGKWDFWYNVKLGKPQEKNKYRLPSALLASLGLEVEETYPAMLLSPLEKRIGQEKLKALGQEKDGATVGVFVGGRHRLGKRWSSDGFAQLISKLATRGVRTVVFFGPEERDLIRFFKDHLAPDVPLVYEPSLRLFAAMVANCQLFVTSDSGPMHLACALGVRTVAIFQRPDVDRWAPPPCLAQIVYEPRGVSVETVETACLTELSQMELSGKAHQL